MTKFAVSMQRVKFTVVAYVKIVKMFLLFVLGAQKKRLLRTVSLSTHNICMFGLLCKKIGRETSEHISPPTR